MEAEKRKAQILQVLARTVRKILEEEKMEFTYLQEIRLRIGQPLRVIYDNEEKTLPIREKQKYIVTKEVIRETMEYISHYSLYAYEHELKQGFLTIEGGHRTGVTGKVIVEQGKVKNIQYIL